MSNMIHGPCGKDLNDKSPCMDDGECTKSFPKELFPETVMSNNGFSTYRRRAGQTHPLKRNNKIYQVDNRWVVPYIPYLCLKYNAHINVEYCASIKSIRYVSAPEAFWRLSKFPLACKSHSIQRLAVDLPREEQVFFTIGLEQQAVDKAASKNTPLTAWFNSNRTTPAARDMFYREIPLHYVFGGTRKPHKRKTNLLSRIYSVSIRQIERFCLRLLLLNVKGATSFQSLKIHRGVEHPTFKAAAISRNLLEDDSTWERVMQSGHEAEIAKNLALKCIQDSLKMNGRLSEDFNLPLPDFQMINQLVANENGENSVIRSTNLIQPRTFFLDGPGGTGKTILYNTLINVLQGQGKKVISVASTGIAATLLTNGATYHSKFQIYPPITETTTSRIEEHEYGAQLIRDASLIICDEATMMSRYALKTLRRMPANLKIYKSVDTVSSEDPGEVANYPTEFLYTISASGIPPHELKLKIGAIVMLLKNINSRQGMCNGLRLIVEELRDNVILAVIAAGKHKGRKVFIPQITIMSPGEFDLPVILNRKQFPIMLAFAVTIKKSQGQTFDRVGIYLPEPVFSHGQLYVAFSRATSREGIKVLCVDGTNQGKLLKYSDDPL
ncbi:uncharacterized protein LOC124189959 [Daphnia pulex]|uniref:uncharacterized protein LOC124189959 n=1 Tax=Daphnia pulex TaxID=6669 RepID=UPI001EDF5513|nr:uncharacterized protein LOC124189959 [Daphnia pulex]